MPPASLTKKCVYIPLRTTQSRQRINDLLQVACEHGKGSAFKKKWSQVLPSGQIKYSSEQINTADDFGAIFLSPFLGGFYG
jgi:hypothetical protein